MLDQVTGMRVFVRVVASGSLAAAGRALGLSQATVTRHIEATEARLGPERRSFGSNGDVSAPVCGPLRANNGDMLRAAVPT